MELIGDTGSFEIVPYGDGTPRLEVSSYYRSVLRKAQSEKDSEVIDYLSGRVDSAVLLIRNIEHRQQTIENVTRFAVNFQHDDHISCHKCNNCRSHPDAGKQQRGTFGFYRRRS